MSSYDLAIIGSGPGGYVAALYASRCKLKVCVVEKDMLGGTCLNRGCIPTKSFINSATTLSDIKSCGQFGITTSKPVVDFAKVYSKKEEVVSRLRTGIETLFRARGIELIRGEGRIIRPGEIIVNNENKLSCRDIIIATGSTPVSATGINIDEIDILSSDGILAATFIPESIVIVGGGVIGCEFASLYNALGSRVSIIEFTDRLLPVLSKEISKKIEAIFRSKGVQILTSSAVEAVDKDGLLRVRVSGGGQILCEKVLVCVGRKVNTSCLGLEECGVRCDVKGRVIVDEFLKTTVSHIYAVGDCVGEPLLAHKASHEGMIACDNIVGEKRKIDRSNIPGCIWTDPEIASVGLNEEEARSKIPNLKVAKFPYLASGKAYLSGKTEGFCKIMGDPEGNIVGVEMMGKGACELISEAVLARTCGIKISEWARVVHAHPTLSEILQEAAHVFEGRNIHVL